MEKLSKFIKEKRELSIACGIIIVLLGLVVYLAMCKQIPKTKDGKEIIASIKGKDITADDLYAELKEQNGTDALMNIIDKYIADKEVKLTEKDNEYVDNAIEYYKQYADYYGVSFEDFLSQYVGLSNVKTEEEFRSYVEADYKKSRAIVKYIGEQLTDDEIKEYYEQNYSEKITAKHILIEVNEDVSEDDAYEEAKELIEELNEVKDDTEKLNELFEDLAYKHSSDSTYENGGLIEDFSKNDVVEAFWNASDELKDGEFTDEPVKTEYGYHIILKVSSSEKEKLKDVKDDVIKSLAESKLSSDPSLQVLTWDELRNKYKLKINDSKIKTSYKNKIDSYKNTDDETSDSEDNNESDEK